MDRAGWKLVTNESWIAEISHTALIQLIDKTSMQSLPFYDAFSHYMAKEVQKRHGEFGGPLLIKLSAMGSGSELYLSKDHHKLMKRFLRARPNTMHKDAKGMTAYDHARKIAAWVCYELLNLSKMGDSMKTRVIEERERLEGLRATATTYLEANNCFKKRSEGYKMMEYIRDSIIRSFEKRHPLSEDMLFICWKWLQKLHDGQPTKSHLWGKISKSLRSALKIPLNAKDWVWFKFNVFHSAV